MIKIKFDIRIRAAKRKVWDVLWNDATYPEWTSPFGIGSSAKYDSWKEGAKVIFQSADGNGMISVINKLHPETFISFKHIGMIKDAVEDFDSDMVKQWVGALENYSLQEENDETVLTMEMDITEAYKPYFENTWPKCLALVKELAEK